MEIAMAGKPAFTISSDAGPRTQEEKDWLEKMKNYLLVQNPYDDLEYIQDVEGVWRDEKEDFKFIVHGYLLANGQPWDLHELKHKINEYYAFIEGKGGVDKYVEKHFKYKTFKEFLEKTDDVARVEEDTGLIFPFLDDSNREFYEDQMRSLKNRDEKERKKDDLIARMLDDPENVRGFYEGMNRLRQAIIKANEVHMEKDFAVAKIPAMDGTDRKLFGININHVNTEYQNLFGVSLAKDCKKMCGRSTLHKGLMQGRPKCLLETITMENKSPEAVSPGERQGMYIALKENSHEYSEAEIQAAVEESRKHMSTVKRRKNEREENEHKKLEKWYKAQERQDDKEKFAKLREELKKEARKELDRQKAKTAQAPPPPSPSSLDTFLPPPSQPIAPSAPSIVSQRDSDDESDEDATPPAAVPATQTALITGSTKSNLHPLRASSQSARAFTPAPAAAAPSMESGVVVGSSVAEYLRNMEQSMSKNPSPPSPPSPPPAASKALADESRDILNEIVAAVPVKPRAVDGDDSSDGDAYSDDEGGNYAKKKKAIEQVKKKTEEENKTQPPAARPPASPPNALETAARAAMGFPPVHKPSAARPGGKEFKPVANPWEDGDTDEPVQQGKPRKPAAAPPPQHQQQTLQPGQPQSLYGQQPLQQPAQSVQQMPPPMMAPPPPPPMGQPYPPFGPPPPVLPPTPGMQGYPPQQPPFGQPPGPWPPGPPPPPMCQLPPPPPGAFPPSSPFPPPHPHHLLALPQQFPPPPSPQNGNFGGQQTPAIYINVVASPAPTSPKQQQPEYQPLPGPGGPPGPPRPYGFPAGSLPELGSLSQTISSYYPPPPSRCQAPVPPHSPYPISPLAQRPGVPDGRRADQPLYAPLEKQKKTKRRDSRERRGGNQYERHNSPRRVDRRDEDYGREERRGGNQYERRNSPRRVDRRSDERYGREEGRGGNQYERRNSPRRVDRRNDERREGRDDRRDERDGRRVGNIPRHEERRVATLGRPQAASTPIDRSQDGELWTMLNQLDTFKRRIRWQIIHTLKNVRDKNFVNNRNMEFVEEQALFYLLQLGCGNDQELAEEIVRAFPTSNNHFRDFLKDMRKDGHIRLYTNRDTQEVFVLDPYTMPPAHFRKFEG